MMIASSFDRTAVQYAGFWQRTERALVDGLAAPDQAVRLRALQKGAGYFRVSRNFPRAFDIRRGLERLAPALEVLEACRSARPSAEDLIDVVGNFRRRLAVAYGKKDVLSAATKFLWLLHQDPVVIFDGRARAALGAKDADYADYLTRWHAGYSGCEQGIRRACAELALDVPKEADWFCHRVYDIHLWNAGAPKGRKRPVAPN